MKFKRVLIIFLIIFLCMDVSFAADSGNILFQDFDDFTENVSSFLMNHLSAGNSSIFNKGNDVKYSFNSSDLIKDYMNDSQYRVQVLADGKPVGPGEKVILRINGVDYVRTTDENGTVQLNINLLPGNYIVVCEYKSYKTYNNIRVI